MPEQADETPGRRGTVHRRRPRTPRTLFGRRVAALGQLQGLTMDALARQCGIHPKTLSKRVLGHAQPKADLLICLARTLQTTTDYLLGLTDDPRRPTS